MKTGQSISALCLVALLTACGGGSDGEVLPPATQVPRTNTAPVANAGAVQSVMSGSVVTLDGSKSSDVDNDTLTYAWTLSTKPPGSSAVLSDATSAKPTFKTDSAGIYVATLVVSDGKGSSPASTVTITASVANAAPVANAGAAQNVVVGSLVTLDGSASSDANGDPLTYAWTLTSRPAGSAAELASATSARPTLPADVAGTYVATLIVNDGTVSSPASTVTIMASVANAAPVANAGVAQNVLVGTLVTLDGSASSDANGDALTYSWTLTSKPVGSITVLVPPTSAKPMLTADVAGTYVATLVVNDGKVSSPLSTVTITASAANAAPVANAGSAQNVVVGTLVTLDGSASSDANKDPLTYAWTLASKPAGSTAVLASATSAKPTFTADVAGTYVASLTVNDGKVSSDASTATVTAAAAAGTLILSQVSRSLSGFGGGSDTLLALPYATSGTAAANVTCVGSGCATVYDVATYKLSAAGRSFTITNLHAVNLSPGSPVTPSFNGLANGQNIEEGKTVTFKLQSPFTKGARVNLRYSFAVLETGETFSNTVELKTN